MAQETQKKALTLGEVCNFFDVVRTPYSIPVEEMRKAFIGLNSNQHDGRILPSLNLFFGCYEGESDLRISCIPEYLSIIEHRDEECAHLFIEEVKEHGGKMVNGKLDPGSIDLQELRKQGISKYLDFFVRGNGLPFIEIGTRDFDFANLYTTCLSCDAARFFSLLTSKGEIVDFLPVDFYEVITTRRTAYTYRGGYRYSKVFADRRINPLTGEKSKDTTFGTKETIEGFCGRKINDDWLFRIVLQQIESYFRQNKHTPFTEDGHIKSPELYYSSPTALFVQLDENTRIAVRAYTYRMKYCRTDRFFGIEPTVYLSIHDTFVAGNIEETPVICDVIYRSRDAGRVVYSEDVADLKL